MISPEHGSEPRNSQKWRRDNPDSDVTCAHPRSYNTSEKHGAAEVNDYEVVPDRYGWIMGKRVFHYPGSFRRAKIEKLSKVPSTSLPRLLSWRIGTP
jgi:hypothetical protein